MSIRVSTARRRASYFTTVYYAIDLAAILYDSELKQPLELIADYPEVVAFGITEPRIEALPAFVFLAWPHSKHGLLAIGLCLFFQSCMLDTLSEYVQEPTVIAPDFGAW